SEPSWGILRYLYERQLMVSLVIVVLVHVLLPRLLARLSGESVKFLANSLLWYLLHGIVATGSYRFLRFPFLRQPSALSLSRTAVGGRLRCAACVAGQTWR